MKVTADLHLKIALVTTAALHSTNSKTSFLYNHTAITFLNQLNQKKHKAHDSCMQEHQRALCCMKPLIKLRCHFLEANCFPSIDVIFHPLLGQQQLKGNTLPKDKFVELDSLRKRKRCGNNAHRFQSITSIFRTWTDSTACTAQQ